MKFLIIEKYGPYTVEAEDLEAAVQQAWNNHTGYDDVYGVGRIEPEAE